METIDYSTPLAFGALVAAAYAYTEPYLAPSGYDILTTIWGNDWNIVTDATASGSPIVRYGFVLHSTTNETEYVVALRGTQTIWEWLQDFASAAFLHECSFAPGRVSQGFDDIYESLQIGNDDGPSGTPLCQYLDGLIKGIQAAHLTIAGHSLGGALATMLTLNYAFTSVDAPIPSLYTYAAPNVGDSTFVDALQAKIPSIVTVVNANDVVPDKPPTWLPVPCDDFFCYYANISPNVPLVSGSEVCQTWYCNHSLTTYLYLLAQKAGQSTFPLSPDCKAPCSDLALGDPI